MVNIGVYGRMEKKDLLDLLKECPTIRDKIWLINLQLKLEVQKK